MTFEKEVTCGVSENDIVQETGTSYKLSWLTITAHILLVVVVLGVVFYLGYTVRDITVEREINGLWFSGTNYTDSEILREASEYDTYGDWVCVNIHGMSIDEIVKTCEHESAHEVFAEKCEGNATKCLELVGVKLVDEKKD